MAMRARWPRIVRSAAAPGVPCWDVHDCGCCARAFSSCFSPFPDFALGGSAPRGAVNLGYGLGTVDPLEDPSREALDGESGDQQRQRRRGGWNPDYAVGFPIYRIRRRAHSRRTRNRCRPGRAAGRSRRRRGGRLGRDHQQGPSGTLPLQRGPGRHQRGPQPRRLLGVARLRHGQGLRLPGRPGRDRDHVPRGAGGDPPPRAPRRHLPSQRGGQARHPRLRRRLRRPHVLRRRHHRPGDHARPLRAADEALRGGRPLRGVVLHGAGAGRRGRVLRRRRPQHRRRLDGALSRQVRDPRLRRQRPGMEADHERPDLHRRRHRDGLPRRSEADGHGDDPVPPDDAGGQGLPDHRGRPRRGRPPAQRQRRTVHGALRAEQDGARLPRRRLPRRADRDQRGPRLPGWHRRT